MGGKLINLSRVYGRYGALECPVSAPTGRRPEIGWTTLQEGWQALNDDADECGDCLAWAVGEEWR